MVFSPRRVWERISKAGPGFRADMMPWSMVADIADEDEIVSGERREGLFVGVFTFVRKLTGAVGVTDSLLATVNDLRPFRGDTVGRASSIKMVRSIMVKGLEALTAECALAAVAAGVADDVFPSLNTGAHPIDVAARATYNFERSFRHGQRRAAEMDEVAKMLSDLGLPNSMATATSAWQRALSSTDIAVPQGEPPDYRWFADRYLDWFDKT